jgi:hypothetical protein
MDGFERDRRGAWSRLRMIGILALVAFATTLAWVIGHRLSDQALAVLAGAVCGVGAAIPTSLLIVSVSRRRLESQDRTQSPQNAYPPVVVVTPQGAQQRPMSWDALPPTVGMPAQRQFTVVGGTSIETATMEEKSHERY